MTKKECDRLIEILKGIKEPIKVEGPLGNFYGIKFSSDDYEFILPFLNAKYEKKYKIGNFEFKTEEYLLMRRVSVTTKSGEKYVVVELSSYENFYEMCLLLLRIYSKRVKYLDLKKDGDKE